MNDKPIEDEKADEYTQSEQLEAFQLAIKVLRNAGLYTSSSLTLQNNGLLRIKITTTNDHPNNPNLNISNQSPYNIAQPAAPHI